MGCLSRGMGYFGNVYIALRLDENPSMTCLVNTGGKELGQNLFGYWCLMISTDDVEKCSVCALT